MRTTRSRARLSRCHALLGTTCLISALALVHCGSGSRPSNAAGEGGTPGGTSDAGAEVPEGGTADAQAGPQTVGVSGTQMTLNGAPWLSRGVVLQGFVRPLSKLQADAAPEDLQHARASFGPAELAAIHQFGADTIRFQIGQPWLDSTSPLYDQDYFDEVVGAIRAARQSGFVVMIMMQDEAISGEVTPHPLPIDVTRAAWDRFAAAFGSDRGVVFELYNEPDLVASPANWQLWLDGGTVQTGSGAQSAIGMQALVDRIRGDGGQNVLVLDGLGNDVHVDGGPPVKELAGTLEGMPAVGDPLQRLVYAVHPYQHGLVIESYWDAAFGAPSASVPVWADEWSAPEGLPLCLGSLTDYQVAVDLLNYLGAHRISVCTGAFDVPKFVVNAVDDATLGWPLTSYDATSAYQSSGTLVHVDFAANYQRMLTKADGL